MSGKAGRLTCSTVSLLGQTATSDRPTWSLAVSLDGMHFRIQFH